MEFPEAAEVKWWEQLLRSLWTFLLVLMNTLWRPSAWQTAEGTTFGTDYSDLLGEQLQKTESESPADV